MIRNLKITVGKYFRGRRWSAVGVKNIPILHLLPPALESASMNEKTIGKSEKHAERDSKNKPKTVRLEVRDPKRPDFLQFMH